MIVRSLVLPCVCLSALTALAACSAVSPEPQVSHFIAIARARVGRGHPGSAGLGPVLTTSDHGEIFGFDTDQNGDDGLLASWNGIEVSLQTFNTTTGEITKTFAVMSGQRVSKGDDWVMDGIYGGDAGVVDFQRAGIAGKTPTHDIYHLVSPVSKSKLNGGWHPPLKLFNVTEWAENQSTTTSVVYGYQREGSDNPSLVVSDVAKNTFSKVIALSLTDFSLATLPQLAQDTIKKRAIMASSPDGGAAGGPPPDIWIIDLATGKKTEFEGAQCPGSVGCGYANGIAYDSKTGIALTDTELDGGIEFYDIAKKTGVNESLPNGGGQDYAGGYIANDPIHKLFLVAQPVSSTGSGSSIQVYKENGELDESINGFSFGGTSVLGSRIAIDPTSRTGWVNGPGDDQLQEFSY
jgi:hypothetical protein